MNNRELAELMLEWGDLQAQADKIAERIKAAVLELGKTQTVGNVRASFRNPRKSYDYEGVGQHAQSAIIAMHTVPKTNWRAVCKDAGIDAPFTVGNGPSVALKLLE